MLADRVAELPVTAEKGLQEPDLGQPCVISDLVPPAEGPCQLDVVIWCQMTPFVLVAVCDRGDKLAELISQAVFDRGEAGIQVFEVMSVQGLQ